jgi:hypothetical protein
MTTLSQAPGGIDVVPRETSDKTLPKDNFSASEDAQTASEYVNIIVPCAWPNEPLRFINHQLKLEADAREALPYVRSGLN